MIVIGLDPGTEKSAMVAYEGNLPLANATLPNEEILAKLATWIDDPVLVIEKIESYGMAVGATTFDTVFWSGRFAQAWSPRRFERLGRREIKLHLCHSARATDSNIRQALIDRFGPSTEQAIGRKASPGPLYGIKGHEIAALAVAITWHDLHKGDGVQLRPGTTAEW